MSMSEIYPKGMLSFCSNPPKAKSGDDVGRLVGIELEIEGLINLPVPSEDGPKFAITPHWNLKRDGSLRNNGGEMVSNPIRTREIGQVIAELNSFAHSSWDAHSRCGTHVHVDIRDLTCDQFRAQVGAYLLLEPVFYAFVGKEREESIYCVPYYRAPKDLKCAIRDLSDDDWHSGLIFGHFCKYMGYNMAPAGKFGTVEFRMAPAWPFWKGTNDIVLAQWAQGCSHFVSAASKFTPDEILNTSPAWLIQRLFPNWMDRISLNDVCAEIEANDCAVAATKLLRGSAPAKFSANTGWKVSKTIPAKPKVAAVTSLDPKYKFVPRGLAGAVEQIAVLNNPGGLQLPMTPPSPAPQQGSVQGSLAQYLAQVAPEPMDPEEDDEPHYVDDFGSMW